MTGAAAWRRYSGRFATPTLLLAGAVVLAMAAIVVAGTRGALPAGVGFVLATVVAYVAFTPMHEAAHGNVAGGNKRWGWIDDAVGWAMAVVLFAPYPAFRTLHLRHHGCTNDPERDPDRWVAAQGPLAVALKCWTIMPHYYAHFLFAIDQRSAKARRERRQVIATIVVFLGVLGAAAATGHFAAVFTYWFAPAYVATGFLALAFDYFPHVPHEAQGRYVDTVTIPGRGLEVLMLAQNYHGVHHLYPRVPFYRYRAVFETIEDEMLAKGSVIRGRVGPGAVTNSRA